ncbi:MAG: hypothetical protein ACXVCP_04355 [Bdellovibrio sp.]
MSTYIELEIQNLLNEEFDLDQVCDRLVQIIENFPDGFSAENINCLARFFVNAQQYTKLIHFVLRYIENESFPIPWPYFLESLGNVSIEFDEKTLTALLEGVQENHHEGEAARSAALDSKLPQLGEWRSDRKYKIHKKYLNNKRLLLEQLTTLRTQQLYEKEKSLLLRLQKMYPGDSEIRKEVNEHKQRHALEVLQRRIPRGRKNKTEDLTPKDPEVENTRKILFECLLSEAEKNAEMAFDFAIVAFLLESYEEALELLSYSSDSTPELWFRLEVLLKCRRFIELLNELAKIEILFSHEPETFFATAYLRAQAMWGLGQKHTAIEVMEGLLASRPQYRAASALLSVWRGA